MDRTTIRQLHSGLRKAALIIAAFATVLVLVFSLQAQTYERENLWKAEIGAFAETDRRQTPPEKAVVFTGSSSIRGWRTLRTDFPSLNVVNRGFGGSHLEDVVHYFNQLVTPYNPRIVVLYAGENDIAAGKTPQRVLEDYRKFASLVRQKLPRALIVFVALKPSPSRREFFEKFREVNSLVKAEIAKDKRAVFADVYAPMLGPGGEPRPELFGGDLLHMNEKGYAIWREVLSPLMRR